MLCQENAEERIRIIMAPRESLRRGAKSKGRLSPAKSSQAKCNTKVDPNGAKAVPVVLSDDD